MLTSAQPWISWQAKIDVSRLPQPGHVAVLRRTCVERLLSKAEKHIFRAEPGHREAMREAMDSLSKFVLGKDPITHRNRTLIGGAFLLGGLYYWMTQRHGDNGPQRVAQEAHQKAEENAERIQREIEEKARRSRG